MAEKVGINNDMFFNARPYGNTAVAEAQAIQRKDSEAESEEVDK